MSVPERLPAGSSSPAGHHQASPFQKIGLLAGCIVLSVLLHIVILYASRMFGTYDFAVPVNLPPAVMVELADRAVPGPEPEQREQQEKQTDEASSPVRTAGRGPSVARPEEQSSDEAPQHYGPQMPEPANGKADREIAAPRNTPLPGAVTADPSPQTDLLFTQLSPGNFLASHYEKLTYQISMFGLPVGSAELESKNDSGEVRITLRIQSNAAFTPLFPVNTTVETRHISGRFIMTSIRQREGAFRSEQMFTVNLGKKRVTYTDLITGTILRTTVPTSDILDTLSGIYYLRNRLLKVGATETLHVYDSGTYAALPVEILRKEFIYLPNLQKVETLVLHPLHKTAGIFKRTGDIMVWVTSDDSRVPVKIVSTIALGTVTVELLSSETRPYDEAVGTVPEKGLHN
jgi:hypothetical protein